MAPRVAIGAVAVMLLATIMGCGGPTRRYEILRRGPLASTFTAVGEERRGQDYSRELAYVQSRRKKFGFASNEVRENLVGLALSGGGIRSATFGLGVMQGLREHEVPVPPASSSAPPRSLLTRMDYLSGTSGGAYITGWLEAHYGSPLHGSPPKPLNERGWEIVADSEHRLLSEDGAGDDPATPNDHLSQLRAHAGFLKSNGFWPAADMLKAYLVRLPAAFIIDVVLHLKGNINWQHMSEVYRERIADTYLHDRGDMGIDELNGNDYATPYVIINGALTNINLREDEPFDKLGYNFEFTRDYTGSDGLGYVETPAFNRRVAGVEWSSECTSGARKPTAVLVKDTGTAPESLDAAWAIAASGAAFDPDGVVSRKNALVRSLAGYFGAAVNLNIGYETWNYARSFNGWWTPFDYLRMFTYQRVAIWIGRSARWIKVTDGGHFDNSSVFALLRRGVQTIISSEAGADPERRYEDRMNLKRLAEQFLKIDVQHEQAWLGDEICLRKGGSAVARIIFLKPSVDFCRSSNTPNVGDDAKICRARDHDATFPQTTTLQQWYDLETFEAYRLLGRKMAAERFETLSDFPPLAVSCPQTPTMAENQPAGVRSTR